MIVFVSVFEKSVVQVMDVLSGPLMRVLEDRVLSNQYRLRQLEQERANLRARLQKQEATAQKTDAVPKSPTSPHKITSV